MSLPLIYLNRHKLPQHFYTLKLERAFCSKKEQALVTKEAVKQVGGAHQVYGVAWKGIMLDGRVEQMPFVYVRGAHQSAFKVFMAPAELKDMAKKYGLPADALAGSFCAVKDNITYTNLEVVPRWQELLDPQWRLAFLKSIAGGKSLPQPDEVNPWQTQANGLITIPALTATATYRNDAKKPTTGWLKFANADKEARAYFHSEAAYLPAFAMSYDKLTGRDRIVVVGQEPIGEENFDKLLFRQLFGEKPQRMEYKFVKRAAASGLYLGSLHSITFCLEGTGEGFRKGELYAVELKRQDNLILISCTLANQPEHIVGQRSLILFLGYPYTDRASLNMKHK